MALADSEIAPPAAERDATLLIWEVQPDRRGRPWEMDLRRYSSGDDFTVARPILIEELAEVLYADSRGKSREFGTKINLWLHLLWSFIDSIERQGAGAFLRVADITSDLGHLFKNWLLADRGLTATTAKGYFNAIHRILMMSRRLHGIPNAPLAWPTIQADNEVLHRDIDPSIFIPLYNELKRRHRITHAMIEEGAKLLPSGVDPRLAEKGHRSKDGKQVAFAAAPNLAWLAKAWIDHTFHHPRTTMQAFGGNFFSAVPIREKPPTAPTALPSHERTRFDSVRWFLPTVDDTAAAYFLVMLHIGWNSDAVENIDVSSPERWCDFRLGEAGSESDRIKTVSIYGFKDKTKKEQIAFSLLRPTFHPYQVILSMIRWTEPMREVLRDRLAAIRSKSSLTKKDRSDAAWLEDYIASPWLYFSPKATGPCGLRIASFRTTSIQNRVLRKFGAAAFNTSASKAKTDSERMKLRGLLDLRQSDLRDGFAAFLYDNSLYNILLVKRALGHGSLRSTRHYLRQKRHIAQRFREFRHFQTVFFDEVRRFKSVDPTILFLRVRHGEITREQRERLSDHRFRTRMEMGCIDPWNPPSEISTGTGPCRVHRCTICRHGVVFEDSLQGLARRAAELRLIRLRTAIDRFEDSGFQKEWIAIEWIAANYFLDRADEFSRIEQAHYDDIIAGRAYLFDQMPGSL